MGTFDLHIDEHTGHLAPHRIDGRHLSLEELHHIHTHEAQNSRWRFILATIALFAMGFELANVLFQFAPWVVIAPN